MSILQWRDPVGLTRPADMPASAMPSMQRALLASVGAAAALAVLSMIGWWAGIAGLSRLIPGTPTARFNASLAIVLVGVAWLLPRVARLAAAGLGGLIGLLTLLEHAAHTTFGIDQLFVNDPANAHPGQMSVVTASLCVLVALLHVLLVTGYVRTAESVALFVIIVNCVLLLGYAYDVSALQSYKTLARIAVTTSISYILLCIAALSAVPRGSLDWASTGQDAGAHLVRRLVPIAFIVLPVLGFLCALGNRDHVLSDAATSALIVVASSVIVGVFTWVAARRVARSDRRRAQAIAELTELRIDLERHAQERARQLQRRHNEIAVLEDRQRIAADLHDIVIQRLFAAGMYLQSGAQDVDPQTRRRLDNAVESMDVAIKDLRASIFELGGRSGRPIDLTTAISDVCNESGRMLGFEPDVLIDDPDEEADPIREDILAVLREGLANVARHAEATAVDVVLRVGDGQVWLTVTDNGKGIADQAHRSGTRNMELRAREYGGECTWTRMDPSGTKVLWRVPVSQTEPVG